MGYYSTHKLTVNKVWESTMTESEVYDELKKDEDLWYVIWDCSWDYGEECKWYQFEDDLKKATLKYPEFSFFLHREWEGYWDITETLFYQGRMKTKWLLPIPEITLDELE